LKEEKEVQLKLYEASRLA